MEDNPWGVDASRNQLSFQAAMTKIIISTVFISGTVAISLFGYFHVKALKKNDAGHTIQYLILSKDSDKILSTTYFAELLNLSKDKPVNIVDFDIEWGKKKLLESPVIQSAKVVKASPNALFIQYRVRQALFHLTDFENAALDREGIIFPVKPFFSKDQLIDLYFGNLQKSTRWGDKLPTNKLQLAIELVGAIKEYLNQDFIVKSVDISKAFALSLGERQIVLILADVTEKSVKWVLRLRTEDFSTQLLNFSQVVKYLKNQGNSQATIVDLRFEQLAFLKTHIPHPAVLENASF